MNIKKFGLALAAATLFVLSTFATLILWNEFPYEYMDLNDNGFVSPSEALRTLDLGLRDAGEDGEICVEVFALKDGLTIKRICPET